MARHKLHATTARRLTTTRQRQVKTNVFSGNECRPTSLTGSCEVQQGVAYGEAGGAPLRWGSRCVEVTQRAVLAAEEESQRETASDTP